MSCRQRVSVLECGDGVFEVAALGRGRGSCIGGAFRDLERCHSQSGDSEDSVTQSKTWRSVGRARLRRALEPFGRDEYQGSTESRPTLRFMASFDLTGSHSPWR